jgi:hypothetical protein
LQTPVVVGTLEENLPVMVMGRSVWEISVYSLMWLVVFILGSGFAGVVIGGVAGRFALAAGGVLLLMGLGPTLALLVHTNIVGPGGDRSGESMKATFALILCAPAGIAAIVTGLVRR